MQFTFLYAGVTEVDRQKKFINDLYSSGDYYNSIAEIYRLKSIDTYSSNHYEYNFFIACNYFKGAQYKSSANFIVSSRIPETYERNILLSQSFFKLRYSASKSRCL